MDSPEFRRNVVRDALSKLSFGPNKQPKQALWISKLEDVVTTTQLHVKQICQAGGAVKPADRQALRETVYTMLLQKFDSWTKEELLFLATTLIADRLMEDVDANPWGNAQPDALS